MEIPLFKDQVDIEAMIDMAVENKCEIQIEIGPNGVNITVSPWEPFHYACPYGNKQSV